MAAPEYVPRPKAEKSRVYESPPWADDSWYQDRPAEILTGQPSGPGLGSQGPDQGFALKLARRYEGQLSLAAGEHEADAIFGCTAVAMKRASLFGRAPVIHDLHIAFTIFGFLTPNPDPELVPEATLRLSPQQVDAQAAQDWRGLFRRKSAGVG